MSYLNLRLIPDFPKFITAAVSLISVSISLGDERNFNDIDKIRDNVVLIKSKNSSGSGVIANFGDKAWLVTNFHVILGARKEDLSVVTMSGKTIALGEMQTTGDLDLVRIGVLVQGNNGLERAKEKPSLDGPVTAYGNSQGQGVITKGTGKILGVAEGKIEVSSEVVPGNSGGPVLNECGDILAIVTYLMAADADPAVAGTRYEQTRRFALMIPEDSKWTAADWNRVAAEGRFVEQTKKMAEDVRSLAAEFTDSPDEMIAAREDLSQELIQIVNWHNSMVTRMNKQIGKTVYGDGVKRENDNLSRSYQKRFRDLGKVLKNFRADQSFKAKAIITPYLEKELTDEMAWIGKIEKYLDHASNEKIIFLESD